MDDSTNFSVPTIGNYTDKINAFWTEMRDAVTALVKKHGAAAVNDAAPEIFYHEDTGRVEFQGTADDIATALDSLIEELNRG